MKEYTGVLIGGPDDGNTVTASVAVIPVVSTSAMWLDGEIVDATITRIHSKGKYTWDENEQAFLWTLDRSFVTKLQAE